MTVNFDTICSYSTKNDPEGSAEISCLQGEARKMYNEASSLLPVKLFVGTGKCKKGEDSCAAKMVADLRKAKNSRSPKFIKGALKDVAKLIKAAKQEQKSGRMGLDKLLSPAQPRQAARPAPLPTETLVDYLIPVNKKTVDVDPEKQWKGQVAKAIKVIAQAAKEDKKKVTLAPFVSTTIENLSKSSLVVLKVLAGRLAIEYNSLCLEKGKPKPKPMPEELGKYYNVLRKLSLPGNSRSLAQAIKSGQITDKYIQELTANAKNQGYAFVGLTGAVKGLLADINSKE